MQTVWETKLPLPLAGRGKVRDIYAVGQDKLLIVTTDRLSAFDVVLPDPIPLKGKVLTQISVFWLDYFSKMMPHHLITADVSKMELGAALTPCLELLEGRSMLVKKSKPLPIECVVRGYVTGSGWKDYLKTGGVCGHVLPKGLKQCQKLDRPIFTPATKAVEGHDENIDREQAAGLTGPDIAKKAENYSIELYRKGAEYAATRGILIADTKFEFGIWNGELILIDEVLTPDSSRFWPKNQYEIGRDQPSFDKQIVRNYLSGLTWDKAPPGPKLPPEVIEKTSLAYVEAYEKLTGKKLRA
ncbi:MAG: phosphoribosylaminoimidazolesuccinocarboxamide synthase [Omnitrophica bacterium GWA2_52_8]|nr:MAG: phosphoribosylaminoimidazolesuccinocarboxamide synthase [Omnitrophica bacterium GWA2_52_8]